MKKFLSLVVVAFLLLTPITSFANEITENTEQQIETEIRDQNIFVPTKNGVQRATYEEALKIAELNKHPLTDLCDAYILGDYRSGKILESYNIDEVKAMASTSKLVSIFVVMDKIKDGTIKKNDMVIIDHESSLLTGSSYKLKENDQKTVWQLIKAALVVSGNDAITALAKHISGSKEAFVSLMNKKCQELGLKNAHMVNPTGLTDYMVEDYNKMTTREMFILARELIKAYPELLEITSLTEIAEPDRNYLEYNTNPALGIIKGVDGLKTGYTNAAGRCLIVTGFRKGDNTHTKDTRLIGVIIGSRTDWQRYVSATKLIGEGLDRYKYTVIGNPDEPVTQIEVENAAKKSIDVYEKSNGTVLWDGKSEISRSFEIKPNLKAPLSEGEFVGVVKYTMNGEEILKQDLILNERVSQKGLINIIMNMYREIFINIKKEMA